MAVFFMSGNVSTDNNGGFVRLSNRINISSNDLKASSSKPKVIMKLMKFM